MQAQSSLIENHVLKRFNILKKVGSGAYGHVWKVQDRLNKKIYALKKIFDAFQHSTDAQRTYRQIEILKQTDHPNIIKLYQSIKAQNNKDVYLLFEFMEADLHNVIAEGILKDVHIKFIIYQLAKALKYLHSGRILHRDLKPSNILINSNCSIKLCDFGLVRSLVPADDCGPVLTEGVATRWYRAPEVLLGSKSYSTPADIWSYGCIIYQILAQKPLFPGNSTVDQIDKILTFTGFPSEDDTKSLESDLSKSMLKQSRVISTNPQAKIILKDLPAPFVDLLQKMLTFNPNKRITIEEILTHEVVRQFRKVEEEITCLKEIRTSIDDNKKLTVQEYRGLIYGTRPINKAVSSSLETKTSLQPKKSVSYTKLASNISLTEKNEKIEKQIKVAEKQMPIKYSKSSKQIKSLHSYNKSESTTNNTGVEPIIKRPSQMKQGAGEEIKNNNYMTKTYLSPKYADYRHSLNNGNVGSYSSSQAIGQQPSQAIANRYMPGVQLGSKPTLIKSSKYVVNRTEESSYDKQ